MKEVVFICTGNTCRSPMAEGLFKKEYPGLYKCSSRGVMAPGGQPANDQAIAAMDQYGVDIRSHQSRQLILGEHSEEDLLITMTQAHKALILSQNPSLSVVTLKELAGQEGDIQDPYGGSEAVYNQCAKEIEMCIQLIGGRIK